MTGSMSGRWCLGSRCRRRPALAGWSIAGCFSGGASLVRLDARAGGPPSRYGGWIGAECQEHAVSVEGDLRRVLLVSVAVGAHPALPASLDGEQVLPELPAPLSRIAHRQDQDRRRGQPRLRRPGDLLQPGPVRFRSRKIERLHVAAAVQVNDERQRLLEGGTYAPCVGQHVVEAASRIRRLDGLVPEPG